MSGALVFLSFQGGIPLNSIPGGWTSVKSCHWWPSVPGQVCGSRPLLPAEGYHWECADTRGSEEHLWKQRRPASGGRIPALRSSHHQPGCFKGADPSRGLFHIRREGCQVHKPSATCINKRAAVWPRPQRMRAVVNFFRCWVPFIKHLPCLRFHGQPIHIQSLHWDRIFCAPFSVLLGYTGKAHSSRPKRRIILLEVPTQALLGRAGTWPFSNHRKEVQK